MGRGDRYGRLRPRRIELVGRAKTTSPLSDKKEGSADGVNRDLVLM